MAYDILVTGGAGYLGSTLVPHLLQAGHRVTVLDNFLFRQSSLNHVCHDPNFQVVKGDIRTESVVAPLLKKADIVIPLAALVGAPMCSADPIMPTTNSAYGTGDADNFCTEESPLRPISIYAKEKVAVESALMEHGNAVSFRLATVFGMSPRMRLDLLVNDFCYRAVHDRFVVLFEGDFKRNYVHVRDVARVFEHGITHFERMQGQIYNVGLSEANVSKRELCQHIQRQIPDFVVQDAAVGKDPDQRNYVVSNAKLESTGFRTAVSLDAGIAELVKGYTMLRNTRYGNV